jgi:DNA repair exonuclease SbcCD ATPase subunit
MTYPGRTNEKFQNMGRAIVDRELKIQELTAEVERLRAEVAEWKQAASAEANLADERGRTIARLRGELGRLEWVSEGEEGCPACDRPRSNGHASGCWLAAELSRDPSEGSQP